MSARLVRLEVSMRSSSRSLRGMALAAALVALGCGSSKDSGPPHMTGTGGAGGASSYDGANADDAAPEPGVCQRLCCRDADCAGLACKPFDPSYGSLGVCMPGTTDAGTGTGDAGPTFGSSCWGLNKPQCNPFTNAECDPGDACDVGALGTGTEPTVSCFYGDNVQAQGETCDNVAGPYCLPGLH